MFGFDRRPATIENPRLHNGTASAIGDDNNSNNNMMQISSAKFVANDQKKQLSSWWWTECIVIRFTEGFFVGLSRVGYPKYIYHYYLYL